MKILHISDTHCSHRNLILDLEGIDVLVHTGDSTNHRDPIFNEAEFFEFLEWFSALKVDHKIYVGGNHDSYLFHNEKKCRELFTQNGIVYLNKESVVIGGFKFYGDPTSPAFGNWWFQSKREKMYKHWELIPEDTDVLLTHTPPQGILDIAFDFNNNFKQVGCSNLRKVVSKMDNLKLHCYGHVHCLTPDYQVLTNNGWKYYNEIRDFDKVFNLNTKNNTLEYDEIKNVVTSFYDGTMYEINNAHFNKRVTPEHKILLEDENGYYYKTIKDVYKSLEKRDDRLNIPITFNYKKKDFPITDEEIRMIVWVAADGSRESRRWRFHLKKKRKIKRLEKLLNDLSINYNKGVLSKTSSLKISFEDEDFQYSKPLPEKVKNFSRRQCRILIEEYLHTDGNFSKQGEGLSSMGQISSSKKTEIDLLMDVLIKSGYSFIGYRKNNTEHFRINIKNDNVTGYNVYKKHINKSVYSGLIWCLSTNNGNFIVRKEGRVMITGNSHPRIKSNAGVFESPKKVLFSNGACVIDGKFSLGCVYRGNLIEL